MGIDESVEAQDTLWGVTERSLLPTQEVLPQSVRVALPTHEVPSRRSF